jgi:hypothetical protein
MIIGLYVGDGEEIGLGVERTVDNVCWPFNGKSIGKAN